jgi:hypothetical protein
MKISWLKEKIAMKKFRFYLPFLLVLSAILVSCSAAGAPSPDMVEGAPSAPEMAREAPGGVANQYDESITGISSTEAIERMVIQNADLELVVEDPSISLEHIRNLAQELGGYVVTANLSRYALTNGEEVPQGDITIRVPAEKLNEAMTRIKSESDQLPQNENINSQDVTKEYTNLDSRLKNLEAAEAQLVEIMDSATRTEDVLAVYNQLVSVREQIEIIKGEMQYYEQSAKFSLISVRLIANAAYQPVSIGGWEPVGVLKNAFEALVRTLQGLVSFVIWLIIFVLPILAVLFIIFVLPIILVIRFIRRRRSRKLQSPAQSEKQ